MITRITNVGIPITTDSSFDSNDMINAFILAQKITTEEFTRDFVVEEFPVEIFTMENSFFNEVRIRVQQEFVIRPKTKEEHQLALEVDHGDNVDRTNEVGPDADLPSGGLAG